MNMGRGRDAFDANSEHAVLFVTSQPGTTTEVRVKKDHT